MRSTRSKKQAIILTKGSFRERLKGGIWSTTALGLLPSSFMFFHLELAASLGLIIRKLASLYSLPVPVPVHEEICV